MAGGTGLTAAADRRPFRGVREERWRPYLGTAFALDVHGKRHLAPMPGAPCLCATDVVPRPDNDCGTVPAAPRAWGALKASHR